MRNAPTRRLGRIWCARFDAQIASAYPKITKDGAPLRRVDVASEWSAYLTDVRSETFILMDGWQGPKLPSRVEGPAAGISFPPPTFPRKLLPLESQRQCVQLLTQQNERDGEADERAGKDKRKSRQE